MLLASLDWSAVIAALIVAVPSTVAAVLGYLNRRQIKTPSGDSLGKMSERTHDLASANTMMLQKINGDLHAKDAPSDG